MTAFARILAGTLVLGIAATSATAGDSATAKSEVVPVSASAASALSPANRVTLEYKFQSGQFVHYSGSNRVVYTTQMPVEIVEQQGNKTVRNVEIKTFQNVQTNESKTHFRVVTVDEQGLALIEPVIDHVRMSAKLHDKPIVKYDSLTDTDPHPDFRPVRDSIGHTVARFQVAPNGKLVKAIIIDANAPPSLREAAEKLDARFPCLSLLPSTPVSVGDKWKEEYSLVVMAEGLKQPIPFRRIYELTALADGIARIKFRSLAMTPVTEPEIEKQIIQQTPTGVIDFDIEKGVVKSYSATVDRTVMNAFGRQSLLKVLGESTEKLTVE